MRCTNKYLKYIGFRTRLIIASLVVAICFSGCGELAYGLDYSTSTDVSSFNVVSKQDSRTVTPFATGLCVVNDDVISTHSDYLENINCAGLFSVNDKSVLYAKNVHDRINPASLTKVMTALVALKYGNPNQTLVATNAVVVNEKGAQLCGLKPGDTLTMDQALRILLIYSANDAAMLIADSVAGSVDRFIDLMNDEAKRLGATNTHFVNPHGLTNSEHYTTAYDLYLIFNAAIKYDAIKEIIQMPEYQTTYYSSDSKEISFDKQSTNLFIRGDYKAPENISVIGGKTGTTAAAGHCLIMLSKDDAGASYISVICGSESTPDLYNGMVDLLAQINK